MGMELCDLEIDIDSSRKMIDKARNQCKDLDIEVEFDNGALVSEDSSGDIWIQGWVKLDEK